MEKNGVIDINNDNLAAIIANPTEYKGMIIDILKGDDSKLATKVRQNLESNIIDQETDILLRQLANIIPYNILIPYLRDQLGLSIQNDKDCVGALESFKNYLTTPEDNDMIDHIIEYVASTEGELDDNIIPELDLLVLVNQIPVEKFTELYNCIDYIKNITE